MPRFRRVVCHCRLDANTMFDNIKVLLPMWNALRGSNDPNHHHTLERLKLRDYIRKC